MKLSRRHFIASAALGAAAAAAGAQECPARRGLGQETALGLSM